MTFKPSLCGISHHRLNVRWGFTNDTRGNHWFPIRVRHFRKNYGNEIESKGVQFPGRGAPEKLIGEANLQSPVIAQKILPKCHRNTRLGCVLTNATIKNRNLDWSTLLCGLPYQLTGFHTVKIQLHVPATSLYPKLTSCWRTTLHGSLWSSAWTKMHYFFHDLSFAHRLSTPAVSRTSWII